LTVLMQESPTISRRLQLTAAAVCLAALIAAALQTYTILNKGGDAYRVGDWLINYTGGFVRRGFLGQLLLFSGRLFPGTLLPLVLSIQLFLYGTLLWFGFHLAREHLDARSSTIFFLLSPATFLFEWLNPQSFRKELLALVLLAALCRQLQQANAYREKVVQKWLWGAAIVLPLLVLSHEASVLLLPYVLLGVVNTGYRRSYLPATILMGILSLLAFAAATSHPGDKNTAQQILRSLENLIPEPSLSKHGHGAILALRHSTSTAWEDLQARVVGHNFEYPKKYTIVLLLSSIPFWLNAIYVRDLLAKSTSRIILLITAAATIVLCAVAKDWGRFIYLNATALTIVLLSSRPRPNPVSPGTNAILIAGVLIFATTWRVPVSRPSFEQGGLAQLLETFR